MHTPQYCHANHLTFNTGHHGHLPTPILSQYKVIIDLSIRGQKQSVCKHKKHSSAFYFNLQKRHQWTSVPNQLKIRYAGLSSEWCPQNYIVQTWHKVRRRWCNCCKLVQGAINLHESLSMSALRAKIICQSTWNILQLHALTVIARALVTWCGIFVHLQQHGVALSIERHPPM